MIKKTTEYEIFKFRDDNRERIDQQHIKRLVNSIKTRNLLEFCPIVVNNAMEVLDGQHRLRAAKELGIEIYYKVEKGLIAEDILILNTSKAWTSSDYLNYYVKNGFEEYQKLQYFIKKHNISLKVALNISMGESRTYYQEYKSGKYKFTQELEDDNLDTCWDTINFIKRMNGFSPYTNSGRFWKALLKLVRHHAFDSVKWRANMEKMVERFGARARTEDYMRMMMEIHNWKNPAKVNLIEESFV